MNLDEDMFRYYIKDAIYMDTQKYSQTCSYFRTNVPIFTWIQTQSWCPNKSKIYGDFLLEDVNTKLQEKIQIKFSLKS